MKSKISLADFLPHLPEQLREGIDTQLKDAGVQPELHRAVAVAGLDEVDERTFSGYASVRTVDRDNEVVLPDGMNLDQFRKAPVLLWGHQWSMPPVGKDLLIASDGYGLKTRSLMAETPLANDLLTLVKGKMLNTSSIGYIPMEFATPNHKSYGSLMDAARKWPEWNSKAEPAAFITKAILLEHSLVSVPANIDALITSVKQFKLAALGKCLHTDVTPPPPAAPAPPAAPKTFAPRLVKTAAQVQIELQAEVTRIVYDELQRRMGRV